MKSELKDKPVIAMYDIRGIQDYIFRTNKVVDIIGASVLVENIISNGLKEIRKESQDPESEYLIDWEGTPLCMDKKMEVLFIGGGNAYVLYEKGSICERYNRRLARYILDKTYSLQLAVAYVEKTESYQQDYDRLQMEMARVKNEMPFTRPMGAPSIVRTEAVTGYPLTTKVRTPAGSEWVSTETALKRENVPKEKEKTVDKIFDNMVAEKGKDSVLAIVHIDGNNMGARIRSLTENITDYKKAVATVRKISANIRTSFEAVYDQMEQYLEDKNLSKNKLIRKIIVAGDDITFICQGRLAISLVQYFTKEITGKVLYSENDTPTQAELEKYGFSVCAGIAFINSHFPFHDGYQVAEACCESAKKRAKLVTRREPEGENGIVGNWLDFQICRHINSADLAEARRINYKISENEKLDRRPYYIPYGIYTDGLFNKMDKRNGDCGIGCLIEYIQYFTTDIGRSIAKTLRGAYSGGSLAVDEYLTFLDSRGYNLPDRGKSTKGFVQLTGEDVRRAVWYDALEVMDLYMDLK